MGTSEGALGTCCDFQSMITEKGNASGSAFKFPNTVYNAAGGYLSICSGIKGYNVTVTNGAQSGLASMAYAMSVLRSGQENAMLATGSDENSDIMTELFGKLGVTSESVVTPFAGNDGFVLSDGSASVLIEDEKAARERGARIYCHAAGYGMAHSNVKFGTLTGSEAGLTNAVNNALADAGMTIELVLRYLNSHSIEQANGELLKIIKLFTNESKRYFEDILDHEVYDNIFSGVARVLVKEKKGFEKDSFSEELQSIVVKDYSSNISKASVNRAIDWLYSSGIIGFAGKIKDCNILDFKAKSRCYFMDIGLTSYFLKHIGCNEGDIAGIVNENFVYLDLKKRLVPPAEIALETPAFATLGQGEIDFYVKSLKTQKTYAIEVKAGKKNSKTVQMILEKEKADYVVYAKGNTHGGIKDNVHTIPIYCIGKYDF